MSNSIHHTETADVRSTWGAPVVFQVSVFRAGATSLEASHTAIVGVRQGTLSFDLHANADDLSLLATLFRKAANAHTRQLRRESPPALQGRRDNEG